jgi:hypothetical protein
MMIDPMSLGPPPVTWEDKFCREMTWEGPPALYVSWERNHATTRTQYARLAGAGDLAFEIATSLVSGFTGTLEELVDVAISLAAPQ